jgi:hypothetical protein
MLWGQPVVHRGHDTAGLGGHITAYPVIGVDRACYPAASVKKQQDAGPLLLLGCKDTHRDLIFPRGNAVLPYPVEPGLSGPAGRQLLQLSLYRVYLFYVQVRIGQQIQRRQHGFVDGHIGSFLVKIVYSHYTPAREVCQI